MSFANLPTDDQLDQVSEALQALLGDMPSQHDYVAICRAARVIVEALETSVVEYPPIGWGAMTLGVVAAA